MKKVINENFQIKINSSFLLISELLLLIEIAIICTPILHRRVTNNGLVIVALIWYVFLIIKKRSISLNRLSIVLILWWVWEVFLRFVGVSSSALGNYFTVFICFDVIIKFQYIIRNMNEKEMFFIIRSVQIIIILNLLSNIVIGIQNPNIHYYAMLYPEKYESFNVVNAPFYNMLIFFIGSATLLYCNESKRIWKIWDIVCIVLAYFFMLNYETRATSFAISIFMVVGILIICKRGIKGIIIITGIMLVFAIFMININAFINYLPQRISVRYVAILSRFRGDNSGENYLGRIELAINSLKTFISSPRTIFLGAGNHTSNNELVGNHSLIIDYLAKYGLLGIIFIIYYYRGSYKILFVRTDDIILKKILFLFFLIYIVLGVLTNALKPMVSVGAFLLMGLSIDYLNKKSRLS